MIRDEAGWRSAAYAFRKAFVFEGLVFCGHLERQTPFESCITALSQILPLTRSCSKNA